MFTAEFSEFSYGYALTDNIMHGGFPTTGSAPVFPSLLAEGSAGGGYDVRIPLYPVPVFLQFKIPQVVFRRSIKMPAGFSKPYLRMQLRTASPNQHELLRKLEGSGNLVAYASPNFWKASHLDAYFEGNEVPDRTSYFLPSQIGALDNRSHQISYCPNHPNAWVYSTPRSLDGPFDAASFRARVAAACAAAQRREPLAFLDSLATLIDRLATPDGLRADRHEVHIDKIAANRQPTPETIRLAVRYTGYLAQVRLGCTLFLTGRNY